MISSMIESLSHPATRHAALVHTPIALSMLVIPATMALAWTAGRSSVLRWCCVALMVIGMVTGWLAEEAGELAINELDTTALTEQAIQTLETHEEMGERVWLMFAAGAVACTLTKINKKPVRITALIAAMLLSVMLAGYVAVTAHHGGILVYEHGVGVPISSAK